jgi:hypothetical protein
MSATNEGWFSVQISASPERSSLASISRSSGTNKGRRMSHLGEGVGIFAAHLAKQKHGLVTLRAAANDPLDPLRDRGGVRIV